MFASDHARTTDATQVPATLVLLDADPARFRGIAFFAEAMASLLDVVAYGLVLLDERGRAVLVNRAATELAAQPGGIRIGGHGLDAAREDDRTALQRLVANALAANAGGSLTIAREGFAPLLVTVVPLAAHASLPIAACAAVVLTDSAQLRRVSFETLSTLFGLTQAECRVATSLAATHRLSETAAALGISLETGRSHLKRIFHKTETSRLSEFIRLYERLGTVRTRMT